MSQSPYVTSVLREFVQGVVGASVAWLLTCTVAGVIATVAGADNLEDVGWVWAFAWIGHLCIAAMGAWGFTVLFIHAVCLGALVHGTERVVRVLASAFLAQLTASVIVVAGFERAHPSRVILVWVVVATPVIVYLIGSFVRHAHE